ncbi:MAG TPA: hypothetical protein VIQ99_06220, partial [Gammaproteobacteria bacterium]
MSLRLQLLAVGLLTLVLPWTGFHYVQEMEAALRAGLEQSLLGSASTVAAALEEQGAALCIPPQCVAQRPGLTIYATTLAQEPELDGARDDVWGLAVEAGGPIGAEPPQGAGHRLGAGVYGRFLYLYVSAADRDLVYQRLPGQTPYGDRVVLATERAGGEPHWWLLNTAAPGAFRAQETGPEKFEPSEVYDARIIGA